MVFFFYLFLFVVGWVNDSNPDFSIVFEDKNGGTTAHLNFSVIRNFITIIKIFWIFLFLGKYEVSSAFQISSKLRMSLQILFLQGNNVSSCLFC